MVAAELPPASFSAQDALVAAMVGVSASDENMTTSELLSISRMVSTLPIFYGYDLDRLRTVGETVLDLFTEEDGLDALFGLIRDALPDSLRRPPMRSAATSPPPTATPFRPSCSSCWSSATNSASTGSTRPRSSAAAPAIAGCRRRAERSARAPRTVTPRAAPPIGAAAPVPAPAPPRPGRGAGRVGPLLRANRRPASGVVGEDREGEPPPPGDVSGQRRDEVERPGLGAHLHPADLDRPPVRVEDRPLLEEPASPSARASSAPSSAGVIREASLSPEWLTGFPGEPIARPHPAGHRRRRRREPLRRSPRAWLARSPITSAVRFVE